MFGLRPFELIVILVIILLLFGVGRISKLGGELGSGIKSFKEGLTGKKSQPEEPVQEDHEQEKTDNNS